MRKPLLTTLLAAAVIGGPISTASANDFAAGLAVGIIGTAVAADIKRKNQQRRANTTRRTSTKAKPTISAAQRSENRSVQTALNYFGFNAGGADGILGKRSRAAISAYQIHLGYPATGYLNEFERNFLLVSHNRALSGGAVTVNHVARLGGVPAALLLAYRDGAVAPAPNALPQPTITATAPVATGGPVPQDVAATTGLPTFLAKPQGQASLASHCNTVSLVTNTNGGFTTLASMSDPQVALNEQFCLARTYAISSGESLMDKVTGVTASEVEAQCAGLGQALSKAVTAVSLQPLDAVRQEVASVVVASGLPPAALVDTSKICLSVGYRTDNMEVGLSSALLLVTLGETSYAELIGHHLGQGFGTPKRVDLALPWYEMGIGSAQVNAVFAPAQPERNGLVLAAANRIAGKEPALTVVPVGATTQSNAGLPVIAVSD